MRIGWSRILYDLQTGDWIRCSRTRRIFKGPGFLQGATALFHR